MPSGSRVYSRTMKYLAEARRHEQRKKATLNAAPGRRHTAGSAGVSRRPPTKADGPGISERVGEEVC